MAIRDASDRPHPGWGVLCIAIGLAPIAISTRLLPVDAAAAHAPMWVIFVCGVVFVIAGVMILVGQNSRLSNLCATILLAAMGTIGAWVALFGQSSAFGGGIPFLSPHSNSTLARCLFGLGALVSFGLSVYALRRLASNP